MTAGIIPADAGSTFRSSFMWCGSKDHPRGCGEHLSSPAPTIAPCGSSPRMRGALDNALEQTGVWRIIPADAGSTDVA